MFDLFTENKMMLALSANEPEALQACSPDPSLVELEFRAVSILSDLYDREIISTIGWAKQVPGKPLEVSLYSEQMPSE